MKYFRLSVKILSFWGVWRPFSCRFGFAWAAGHACGGVRPYRSAFLCGGCSREIGQAGPVWTNFPREIGPTEPILTNFPGEIAVRSSFGPISRGRSVQRDSFGRISLGKSLFGADLDQFPAGIEQSGFSFSLFPPVSGLFFPSFDLFPWFFCFLFSLLDMFSEVLRFALLRSKLFPPVWGLKRPRGILADGRSLHKKPPARLSRGSDGHAGGCVGTAPGAQLL